jgi:deoxyribose-phosphate aldolase
VPEPDVQRVVEIIVEELAAARNGAAPACCDCHAVLSACCPDRVGGILEAGASRIGLHAAGGPPGDVASIIDHTLLRADATRHEIETLCQEAARYRFASVCVNATWVATCARILQGSGVKVGSVVGFPLGATTSDTKQFETRRAIFDGAGEIDMVINVGVLKSGDTRLVERDVDAVTGTCRELGVVSKVIVEAALLTDDEKVMACVLAQRAGADYVKTSTGFGPGGATAHDVALMRQAVGDAMGIKAAGGVKDLDDVRTMVTAGASRIGASAGVRIVHESRR